MIGLSLTRLSKPSRILPAVLAYEGRRVGGKFSRQARMARAGVRVPDFFCLPTEVFAETALPLWAKIRSILAETALDDAAAIRLASQQIEALFLSVRLPDGFEQQVLASFDAHFDRAQFVAVRASMVAVRREESEDSAEHSFAGISSSFLFQKREQVIDSIRRCWASGFSPEAILYRHKQAMSLTEFAVAVGVQAMIEGERSFVMFTCNPQTLTRDLVVIAGYGAGEGVVQESVPVDHYFVNAQTDEVQREVAHKHEQLVLNSQVGSGLCRGEVSGEARDRECLSDLELHELAGWGRRIENLFGQPQDIEGTITKDGTIHFVQARPVSIAYERYRVFSNANVSESFPGHTTALTFSFAREFYRGLLFDYMRRCGVSARALHDSQATLARLLGYVQGRIYHNVTAFHAVNALHPLYRLFRKDWDRDNAELKSFYVQAPPNAAPLGVIERARILFGMASAWFIALSHLLLLGPRFERFARDWQALMTRYRPRAATPASPMELLADYRAVWTQVHNWWGITLINYQNMIFFNTQAQRLIKHWQVSDDDSLLSDLLCGDEQLLGVEIVLSVVRIADQVRDDVIMNRRATRASAQQLWQEHVAGALPAAISEAIDLHLARYGDRGLSELKLEQPNLRDTPWELMGMIARYVGLDVTAQSLFETEAKARKNGEQRLRAALSRHPVRRFWLRFVVAQLRRALRFRERGRYFRSELFGYGKTVFLQFGRALHQRGLLECPEDVMHLQEQEVLGYLEGTGVTEDLTALVRLRKLELEQASRRQPQKEFTTGDIVQYCIPEEARDGDEAAGALRGIGSSAGKVRGRARVVLDPHLGAELPPDTILIARETDPGWLFLMLSARGIVVERGSMLSHTAITGRKFGIPTVVAVKHATTRIPDGAWLEIDGATGKIERLACAPAQGDAA